MTTKYRLNDKEHVRRPKKKKNMEKGRKKNINARNDSSSRTYKYLCFFYPLPCDVFTIKKNKKIIKHNARARTSVLRDPIAIHRRKRGPRNRFILFLFASHSLRHFPTATNAHISIDSIVATTQWLLFVWLFSSFVSPALIAWTKSIYWEIIFVHANGNYRSTFRAMHSIPFSLISFFCLFASLMRTRTDRIR